MAFPRSLFSSLLVLASNIYATNNFLSHYFFQGIWALSIALAIPQVCMLWHKNRDVSENFNLLQTLFTLHIDKEYHMCIPRTESQHYFAISTFLIFVIPMSVITILYILIGLQLRKSKIVQRGNINGSSVRLKVRSPDFRKIYVKNDTHLLLKFNFSSRMPQF